MVALKRERDVFGNISKVDGVSVEFSYTYPDANRQFHAGVTKLSNQLFDNFVRVYERRVPKRTGTLAAGFVTRDRKRYGPQSRPSVTTQSVQTFVPYARIVEAGGRGKRYAGTRRAGHQARIFRTERRKLSRSVKALVESLYGGR